MSRPRCGTRDGRPSSQPGWLRRDESGVPMVGRTAALISGLALVFAAGACATTTTAGDGTGQSPGTVTVHPYWESCAAATGSNDIHPDGAQDALSLPRLDDRFQ